MSASEVASTPAAFMTVVSHGVRSELTHSSTRWSATTSHSAARGRTATTIQ